MFNQIKYFISTKAGKYFHNHIQNAYEAMSNRKVILIH